MAVDPAAYHEGITSISGQPPPDKEQRAVLFFAGPCTMNSPLLFAATRHSRIGQLQPPIQAQRLQIPRLMMQPIM